MSKLMPWEVMAGKKSKEQERADIIREYHLQQAEDTGTLESMLIGGGEAAHNTIEGIKQLVQGDDYKGSRFDSGEGFATLKEENPWAVGGGQILSDIAQMALPGGAVGKIAKLSKLGKAAPLVGDLAGGVAVAGAKKPGEGRTRSENMQSDALATIAGGVAAKGLGKLVDGSTLVKGAREYMDRGGILTPGQAAEGGVAGGLDRFSRLIPGISPAMRRLENQTKKLWHIDALKAAALPGTKVTKSGREGLDQVSEGFKRAYKKAWTGAEYKHVSPKAMMDSLEESVNGLYRQDDQTALKGLMKDLEGKITAMKSAPRDQRGAYYDVIDKTLNAAKIKAGGSDKTTLAANISDGLSAWRRKLPDRVKDELAEVDQYYPGFLIVDDAGFAASEHVGNFSSSQANTAMKAVSGKDAWRKGEAALQDIIETGLRTVGRVNELGQPGLAAEISKSLPGAVTGRGIRRITDPLIGNAPTQKAIRAANEFRKKGIDEIISGGRLGAAINDGDMPSTNKKEIDAIVDDLVESFGLTTDKKKKRKQKNLFN